MMVRGNGKMIFVATLPREPWVIIIFFANSLVV